MPGWGRAVGGGDTPTSRVGTADWLCAPGEAEIETWLMGLVPLLGAAMGEAVRVPWLAGRAVAVAFTATVSLRGLGVVAVPLPPPLVPGWPATITAVQAAATNSANRAIASCLLAADLVGGLGAVCERRRGHKTCAQCRRRRLRGGREGMPSARPPPCPSLHRYSPTPRTSPCVQASAAAVVALQLWRRIAPTTRGQSSPGDVALSFAVDRGNCRNPPPAKPLPLGALPKARSHASSGGWSWAAVTPGLNSRFHLLNAAR